MIKKSLAIATKNTADFTASTRFLKTPEAAELLNVSIAWLERQRWLGTGPKYIKIGRSVRYPDAELAKYIAANLVNTLPKA